MDTAFEDKMAQITELTDLFERNKKQYHSSQYDEANTRTDFIDKFFELLGWDVRNKQGYSEQYREVIREDKVTIGGKVKAPDYAFRIGGVRKFFVEAKKPSVNIKDDLEPAFQVRRYGYTAKLPLCILTDFEEFAVYDTRIKPSPSDKPSTARVFYCTCNEYHKHFDFIFNTFSKEAILKGSFDSYIQENKNKKGTSEVDKELLKLIESWRTDIAKNIALRNPSLSIYHLNTAVQKIIDRIIFLRIAEDKEMEDYGTLLGICGHLRCYGTKNNTQCTVSTPPFILDAVPSSCSTYSQKTFDSHETESGAVYQKLQGIFDKANAKYNSGLFKPHDWLRSLIIDDTVLSAIINGLYYPECPYEFSILPVEILGNIYEQFLGKTIKFRNVKGGHTALIEEKPEVKKAGGVYYTPQYIVRYIVENTIGVKIKGKTPQAISQLKVVDPACGSGSFLVEAYQELLNYHLDYYSNEKKRGDALKKNLIYEAASGSYKLTIEEKQRILLNNIYGVDIDGQAVEVTKLSLYLKLLENEGSETQGQLFKFSDMTLLPSLDSNIKCGNSLVGSDYYNEKDLSLFDDEAMRKINTFDWDKEFPEVFAQGGFDCVIGNPPYLRVQGLREYYAEESKYYEQVYKSATGRFDFYILFIEKGFTLLNKDGMQSFILPHKFINSDFGSGIRQFIYENHALNSIVHFESHLVFSTASVYTCIIGLSHNNTDFKFIKTEPEKITDELIFDIFQFDILKDNSAWHLSASTDTALIAKLQLQKLTVKHIFKGIFQGIVSGDNKAFYLSDCTLKEELIIGYNSVTETYVEIEKELCVPILTGKTIGRYNYTDRKEYIIYPYHILNEKTVFYSEQEMKTQFPKCYQYFKSIKTRLAKRGTASMKYPIWYALWNPRNIHILSTKKILTPDICFGSSMFFDDTGAFYYNDTAYGLVLNNPDDNKYYAYLAILNSPIAWYFLTKTGTSLRGGYFRFKTKYLEPFPLPDLNEEYTSLLSELSKNISLNQQKLSSVNIEEDKKLILKRIDILDKKINSIVYKLYGLTEEEVKIVEGR